MQVEVDQSRDSTNVPASYSRNQPCVGVLSSLTDRKFLCRSEPVGFLHKSHCPPNSRYRSRLGRIQRHCYCWRCCLRRKIIRGLRTTAPSREKDFLPLCAAREIVIRSARHSRSPVKSNYQLRSHFRIVFS